MGTDKILPYMKCALKMKEKCEMANLRVIKTIRLSMRAISQLMEEFPELKIIHLIRDARATLMSQSGFERCRPGHGGYEGSSNRFCTRLENDILESEVLQKKSLKTEDKNRVLRDDCNESYSSIIKFIRVLRNSIHG